MTPKTLRHRLLLIICMLCSELVRSQHIEQKMCSHVTSKLKFENGARSSMASTALNNYDVTFYQVNLEADNQSSAFAANVVMKARVTVATIDEIVIELSNGLTTDSVYVNGNKVSFSHADNLITAAVPSINQDQFFTSVVYYHRYEPTSLTDGIVNRDWAGSKVTFTQSEPFQATDWFACKQILADKADSVYIFITVPNALKAGSNGILTNVKAIGDKKRYEWKTYYPIAYYLISISIADYEEYTTTCTIAGKTFPIQNYVYSGKLNEYKEVIDKVDDLIILFSDLFGPYPFINEKYGHCTAPTNLEHQTMTTITSFDFIITAHELSHQWFGDNVTCSSFQHIWLNEGFASYAEYLALEKLQSKAVAYEENMQIKYADVLSKSDGSVFVPDAFKSDRQRIFDATFTYNKGAVILHMIRNIINNDDIFFNVLKTYQSKFKGSVGSVDNFKLIVEQKSGVDFTNFFNEWYYGMGHPIYEFKWHYKGGELTIQQIQTTSSSTTPFFHTPIEFKATLNNGDTLIRINPNAADETFKIKCRAVSNLTVDPNKWLVKEIEEEGSTEVTGIEKQPSKAFLVYPNPSSKIFVVEPVGNDRSYSLELRSISGGVITKNDKVLEKSEIDIEAYSNGIYILKLTFKDNIEYHKLTVSH